jgi:hypothetical protein
LQAKRDDAHANPLQREAPATGATGGDTMDKAGCDMHRITSAASTWTHKSVPINEYFQISQVCIEIEKTIQLEY